MSFPIEIETQDGGLGSELIRKVVHLPANVALKIVDQAQATFFLSMGNRVDAGRVANWLFENIRDRATKLRMDRTEVQISQDQIEKTIIEKNKKRSNSVFMPHPMIHVIDRWYSAKV